MDQIVQFVLMILVIILGIFVFIKLTLNRKKGYKKAVGIVITKNYSKADEFSVSKGYMSTKEIYSVKIKCGEEDKQYQVSEPLYSLLEANQKICFEYSGDIIYNFEVM